MTRETRLAIDRDTQSSVERIAHLVKVSLLLETSLDVVVKRRPAGNNGGAEEE